MANARYRQFSERMLEQATNTDVAGGNIFLYLVATSGVATPYTFDTDHEFLSSIDASARIAASPNALSLVSVADGLLDASDLTGGDRITGVGDDWQAIVFVLRAGGSENPAADRLMLYFDTGFTATPSGVDVSVQFPSGIAQY